VEGFGGIFGGNWYFSLKRSVVVTVFGGILEESVFSLQVSFSVEGFGRIWEKKDYFLSKYSS
jgi:hypothetical protein